MNKKEFKNRFLIIGTAVTSIIYIIWRIFFTIPFGYGIVSLIAGLTLLIVEILGLIEAAIHYKNMSNLYYPKRPVITDDKLYPDVDVFIATYNEPVELLYKTVNGCLNMRYPDKSKVHIYICDDSNRTEMRNLAKKFNVGYITRTEHKDAKAGNLNNAMSKTNSPLIATFDADMIPMHDFLMATVPYFIGKVEDKYANKKKKWDSDKIGFIQTPQSFYNSDLFQYNLFSEDRIPNEQDYFYRDIQLSKNKTNSVIYGGSNTVISRKALDEIGGFYTKVITEDFATGMLIQSKGYRCYAIDEIHASGLSPEDLQSLIKQRERWARGCIQTGRKLNIFFRKGLTFRQKISYLISIAYWYSSIKRLVYIISPILYSVFGITVVKCNTTEVLMFWLPMYIFNDIALTKLSNNIRNRKWSNVYETILFPSLIFTVILETFGISQKKFSVTKKEGAHFDRRYQIRRAIPHILLAILSVIGIARTVDLIFDLSSPIYGILLFWLMINLYNILMSIFFMFGRLVNRKAERFHAQAECEISFKGFKTIKCITYDISERGIAAELKFPEYIPYDEEIQIKLKDNGYECEFTGQISNVRMQEDKWIYGIELKRIDEQDLKEYLKMLYDREPDSPKTIERYSSVYDDIRLNLTMPRRKSISFDGKLPRVQLEKQFETVELGTVTVLTFNYEYILVRLRGTQKPVEDLTVKVFKDTNIMCHLGKSAENQTEAIRLSESPDKRNVHLYVVENYREIAKSERVKMILSVWIMEHDRKKINYNKRIKSSSRKMIPDDELDELSHL